MVPLKAIKYRGGLVTFSIPASWCEEYEPDGGGTFYEDRPDSGTLRLNVLTFEMPASPHHVSTLGVVTRAESTKQHDREIRSLTNGNAVAQYIRSTTEGEQPRQIHYWEVASLLPPRHVRLALFSYTLLQSQMSETHVREELDLLDRLIGEAQFAEELGV